MRSSGLSVFFLNFALVACDGEKSDTGTDPGIADLDGDGATADVDCDDADPTVSPDADEICDGIDNNCDGTVDEGDAIDARTWYADADADAFGDAADAVQACEAPNGYVSDPTDCDDADPTISPDATEVCNGSDDDCDGDVDDADDSLDASTGETFYADVDEDTYGDLANSTLACLVPDGFVADSTDCDDTDGDINPAAVEVCDEDDNDCDGDIDDADDSLDASTGETWYEDADEDGYGDSTSSVMACVQPVTYVSDSTDCDDSDRDINPAAVEVCDEDDNDCDGDIDDADDSLDASTGETWYEDADEDGYGDSTSSVMTCDAPSGYVTDNTDCDDGDFEINPGVAEVCNGSDDDCDGDVDDDDSSLDPDTAGTDRFYFDEDEDGYGDPDVSTLTCDAPSGYVSDNTDCDDGDFEINPGVAEVCNGSDDDCDGDVDDDDSSLDPDTAGTDRFHADDDGDGFGDADDSVLACEAPSGYVFGSSDCDDTDADINTDAEEVCDGVDNDCDGDVDDEDSDVDTCSSGLAVSELEEGDLVITEIMPDPSDVTDSNGEWFEVYNAAGDAVDLEDLVLTDNAGTHTVSGAVVIDVDGYAVFCLNGDAETNGGVDCDYDYSGLTLANGGDQLALSYSTTRFDAVSYSGSAAGASLALGSTGACADTDANDVEGIWCEESTEQYNTTDYGTPGTDNSADCFSSADYGYVTTSTTATTAASGISVAWPLSVSNDSYLTAFEAHASLGGSGNLKLALYTDDSGEPGDLIAQSEDTAEAAGTFTLDIDYDATASDTCEAVLEAGAYWIVAKGTRSGSSATMGYVTNTTGVSVSGYTTTEGYAADFPDPYSGTAATLTYRLHIGIVVDEQ
ncbi:MAG: MopE-related protein [Myxococcota bacterium]